MDFPAIDRMTVYELRLRRQAYHRQVKDHQYDMHLQAWLDWAVQQTKSQGKKVVPVYRRFSDFYSPAETETNAEADEGKRRMKEMLKKQRERREPNGSI